MHLRHVVHFGLVAIYSFIAVFSPAVFSYFSCECSLRVFCSRFLCCVLLRRTEDEQIYSHRSCTTSFFSTATYLEEIRTAGIYLIFSDILVIT